MGFQFGSLASGIAGGVQQGQRLRLMKQAEKAGEYELDKESDSRAGRRRAIEATAEQYGLEKPTFESNALPDPYLFRFAKWAKDKMGGGQPQAALAPEPEMPSAPPAPMGDEPPDAEGFAGAYRDGGAIKGDYVSPKERVAGGRKAIEPEAPKSAPAAGEKPGLLRRAGGALKRGAAAGAAIGAMQGAYDAYNTPTEEMYGELGMNPADAGLSFWKDAGVRTLGTMKRVGDALLSPFSGGSAAAPQAEPAAEAPPAAAAAPAPTAAPTTVTRRAAISSASRAPAAAPAPEEGPDERQVVDLSNAKFDPNEMPNMNVGDWEKYRQQMTLAAVQQGKSPDDADKEITAMQQRGFLRYGQQALAHMQAGNLQGAARALKAAYQYFPNGYDVKFGVQNGHIIGMGFNEQTGEPEGNPMILTPERLSVMMENFTNPQAFRMWTQDWRKQAMENRKYNEIEKPQAQSQIDYQQTMGRAALMNAQASQDRADAAMVAAERSGAAGGKTMTAAEKVYRERVQLLGITDEATADELASVMSQMKQKYPNTPDNVIVERVMERYRASQGTEE